MSYENGLAIAFMLWLVSMITTLVLINSRLERNLNKIGQRLGWLTLTPKAMDAEEMNRSAFKKIFKFLFIAGFGLPFVLLSWLYVAVFLGTFIFRRSKDAGAPQAVREFRWKMKNVDMSFDDIVREMMKASDQPIDEFERVRGEILEEMAGRGFGVVLHGS